MTIRVLICDGLPIVRDGLRTVLEREPDIDVAGTTDNANEALGMVRRLHPHVVLTDMALAGVSGTELTRRLQSETVDPQPGILVFTSQGDDGSILKILEAGATGFLLKGASKEEIAAAIRAVAAGQAMLAPCVARRLLDWFFRRDSRPDCGVPPALLSLTPRERQVLQLIASGLSSVEVAKELVVGVATVRTHTYRLQQKLGVRDRAQLVSFAYRSGLVLAV